MQDGQLKELCKYMEFKALPKDYDLFKEGDVGDNFYIIHEGCVLVHSAAKGKLTELYSGDSVGELALLYGQPRAATVTALDNCELIVLSKKAYDKIIRVFCMQKIQAQGEDYFSFMTNIPIFHSMSTTTIKYFAQIASLRRYPANTVLFSQGERPNAMYFIYAGSIKAYRTLSLPRNRFEMKKSEQILLDEFHEGGSLGDYEVLNDIPMQFSAICSMPCHLFVLEKDDLMKIRLDSIKEMTVKTQPYPSDDELRRIFLEKKK